VSDPLTPDDLERMRQEHPRSKQDDGKWCDGNHALAAYPCDAVRLLDEVERLEKWVQRAVWIYKDVHDDPDWNAWSLITEMAESAKVVN